MRAALQIAHKVRRDQLERKVRLDPLTRMPNRRELERVLEVEWRRGLRSKLPLAVGLFDIDHFKGFNDTYGHQKGDHCLFSVARVLAGSLRRSSDLLARYGGEEFAVVLPDCNEWGAITVAEKCRLAVQALHTPHAASPLEVVTVSVGVATAVPTPGANLRDLIDLADKRLYEAKSAGRNRVVST